MTVFAFSHRPLASIGAEVEFDLSGQLCGAQQEALRALLYSQGLLLFRGQSLSDDDQTRILGIFGPVLVEEGGHREIAADGNLGCCRLLYHSDLAFTPEPFKLLSLYGLEVEPERNITLFASATKAAETLPVVLRKRIAPLEVRTVIPASQVERATSHETPDFLPQVTGSMLMPHPVTGRPILNVSEIRRIRASDDCGASPSQTRPSFSSVRNSASKIRASSPGDPAARSWSIEQRKGKRNAVQSLASTRTSSLRRYGDRAQAGRYRRSRNPSLSA
jgi:alpha-ketoglutarate-dependent taurine dioxygenase